MLRQFRHADHRLMYLLPFLELEGNGNNPHGQDTHLLRHLCHNGRRTCARATAHAGCDKCHARAVVEHALDVVDALLGCYASFLGLVAGSESLFAEL